jgi:hypothetical protein
MARSKKEPVGVSNIQVLSYLKSGTVAPRIDEIYTMDPWVHFGRRNDFPEKMRTLVDNCAPLERCIHTCAMLIAGNGVKFYDKEGEEIEEASDAFDTLMEGTTQEEFLFSSAYDIAFLNARAWGLRRAFGADIVRLDHVDVMRVRSEDIDEETGKVPAYWYSTNWPKRLTNKRYKPERIQAYGNGVDVRELMYSKAYKNGRDIYGEPWWMGAIKAAEVWAKVDVFNADQIDTGFHPAMHVHTFTNLQGEDLKKYDATVQRVYTGPMSRSLLHTYSSPGADMAPVVTPIPRGDHAGELDAIRDGCERVIANAYGMPPALMGIDIKSGIDGADKALEQAYNQVMKMLIHPKQQMITKDLVKVMNAIGLTDVWEARIEPLSVLADKLERREYGIAYMAAVTRDEHRENVLKLPPMEDPEQGAKLLNETASAPAAPQSEPQPEGEP